VAPRNSCERQLARLFRRVPGCEEEVGVHDDFFQLGGHSLGAVELISELRRSQGLAIDLLALFGRPTIAALAALLQTP
jgi:aryl carrier-like protein